MSKAVAPLLPLSAEQQKQLRRKNRRKAVRCALQFALLALAAALIVRSVFFSARYRSWRDEPATVAAAARTANADSSGFIAVSYAGLALTDDPSVTLVSRRAYEEQLAALHANGYQTITQQDALNHYQYGAALPEKALLLLFEDGIGDTTVLAQGALARNNYLATVNTYANNLNAIGGKFLTTADVRKLLGSSYWELGTGGYRLSYINVFDRYGNSFGHLNSDEYVNVHQYLKRDYNHYLMDYLRNEDRLREESPDEMKRRIQDDYDGMRLTYAEAFGAVPQLYILMHANTGMFGTDAEVSAENRRHIMTQFAMNFNRMGSCLNTTASSVFDLTRLQVQSYWSTNCLLMRIWDDTGVPVTFVRGDAEEASLWDTLAGAAEFREHHTIVLTSQPRDVGQLLLRHVRADDLTLEATLQGNVYGHQAIYLRTDRGLSTGLKLSLDRNVLSVCELGNGSETVLWSLDLLAFDGGATQSVKENELEGLIALNEAVSRFDDDPVRRSEAAAELARLSGLRARTIAEGAAPYVPAIDVADRGERRLSLTLKGGKLTISIDGRLAAENLAVSQRQRGMIALEAAPYIAGEYSQRNVYEDVYDGVFTDLTVTDANGETLYAFVPNSTEQLAQAAQSLLDSITGYFMNHF